MSLEPLGSVLRRAGQSRRELSAAHICAFAEAMGDGRFRAKSYKNGVLTLAAPSAAAAHSLSLETTHLQTEINTYFGGKAVRQIRVRPESKVNNQSEYGQ